jgi:hypothetical protein
MVTETITVSDSRVLAEFIRQERFKGLFEKRIGIPPDHMALLMRNGQFVDAYIGAHFTAGDIIHRLRGIVGGSHQISLLIADLKTFQLKWPIRGLTEDKVEVVGVASIDLQINPEKPQNIIGLMQARKTLLKTDILDRIQPHLSDRVVQSALNRLKSTEIRGNEGLQDKIQADVLKEVQRVAGDLGLLIRAVSIEWAMNAVEREAMDRASLERQQEQMDYQLASLKRDLARQQDATEVQLKAKVDLARLEGASEAEIANMVLQNELAFVDAREAGQRVQELKALEHEVAVLQKERAAKFENSLAEADHVLDLTERQARLKRMEGEIEKLDRMLKLELRKAEALAEIEIKSTQDSAAARHIAALQEIELSGLRGETDIKQGALDSEHKRKLAEAQLAQQGEAGRMSAFAQMSPEQILASNPNVSAEAARVLVEQAMALMQQMVEQANRSQIRSEEQARAMFDMGMKGAVGVAHGAGGKPAPEAAPDAKVGKDVAECPKCHLENPVSRRYCTNCGAQLRIG